MLPQAVKHAELLLLHWKPLQLVLPTFRQEFDEPSQRGAGVNVPLLQFEKPQVVVAFWKASAGQLAAAPLHASATSQLPADARHTVPVRETTSEGQDVEEPLHASGGSQAPALARQVVAPPLNTSAGQLTAMPLQISGTSQTPALGRHTVAGPSNTSLGQFALLPVQLSAGSQLPPEGRHAVVGGRKSQLPVVEHAWQAPLQAELQQRPSAQKFEEHSLKAPHTAPSAFLATQPLVPSQYCAPPQLKTSLGQLASPMHVSAESHTPLAARHTLVLL